MKKLYLLEKLYEVHKSFVGFCGKSYELSALVLIVDEKRIVIFVE